MIERLEALKREEREEQERIEAEKERKRLKKEEEMKRKLRGNPFKLETNLRASRKTFAVQTKKSPSGLFTTELSNAAFERMMA